MFKKSKPDQDPDMELFAIHDSKTNSYRDPMFAVNTEDLARQAKRLFATHPNDQLCTNSEDFKVFKIGSYYRKTGLLISQEPEHQFNMHEIRSGYELDKKRLEALSPT